MMNSSCRKGTALFTLTLMATSLFASVAARADVSCRDYYSTYIAQATSPSPVVPVVIVEERPNFHGHYPEYHDHGGRGGDHDGSDDAAAAIAVIAILAALSTTTAAQDAELQDASNVISDIDQAQMGDGAQLRQLQEKVQADMPNGKTASLNQVAAAVNIGNQTRSFCQGGNLKSESELASAVAAWIVAH